MVDTLDLEALPVGRVLRMWVELIHDGLGQPMRVPVLVARGRREGPVCGLTAAIHGNEVNGIPVIHRLFRRTDLERLRGTLVGVPVANITAFMHRQRRTDDGFDLNHLFPGKPKGREADIYAYRLMERVIRKFDLLLDLHTASFGRVNCLYVRADMRNIDTARMAYLQRPQVIVHSEPADGTLRGAAAEAGIHSVTLEIGNPQRFQQELARRSLVGIRSVLSAWGMLPKRQVAPGDAPVICESSSWLYTDHGGLLNVLPTVTERVLAQQVVGRLSDAFGEVVREYVTPHDGVVIGHSTDPVANTGARILHLGRPATEASGLVPRESA